MPRKRKPTTDAVEIIHRCYFEGKPEMMAMLKGDQANDEIAWKVNGLRERAGLTQKKHAKMVGTTVAVLSRLDAAAYERYSLSMLRHSAAALDQRVEIPFRFVPSKTPHRLNLD